MSVIIDKGKEEENNCRNEMQWVFGIAPRPLQHTHKHTHMYACKRTHTQKHRHTHMHAHTHTHTHMHTHKNPTCTHTKKQITFDTSFFSILTWLSTKSVYLTLCQIYLTSSFNDWPDNCCVCVSRPPTQLRWAHKLLHLSVRSSGPPVW